jgi:hypothetical protein
MIRCQDGITVGFVIPFREFIDFFGCDVQRFEKHRHREFASFLGRGAMAISGALLTEKPTELTVTMLLEPLHITPEEIYELPERNDKTHRYSVLATDHETYFVSIAPDGPPWKLAGKPQPLH